VKPSTHDTHDPSAILKSRYRSFPTLPYASLAPVEAVSGEDIGEDLSQLVGAKVQEEVALRQVGFRGTNSHEPGWSPGWSTGRKNQWLNQPVLEGQIVLTEFLNVFESYLFP